MSFSHLSCIGNIASIKITGMKHFAGSFAPLRLHICNLQVRVVVPSPGLCLLPILDCLYRAEVYAGTAEFTVVLPDRLTLDHLYIMYRADGSTCPAGCASFICQEVLVCIMDLAYESVIHEPLQETC